jgi:P-type Ca2+ transporter type 2C
MSLADAPVWHALPSLDAASALGVEPAVGLPVAEAADRLAELGPNVLAQDVAEPGWLAFARQYRDRMQVVLVAAAILSLALGELSTGLVVLVLTLLVAVLRLQQEGRPGAAIARLREMVAPEARVRRDGAVEQLAAEQLVPGDIVLVRAGDVVPADGRLLESATLEADESALTGASVPVSKRVDVVADPDAPLGERADMVYMSTRVTRGSGELVVTATGMATEIGRVVALLRATPEPEPPLARRLSLLTSRALAIAAAALVLTVVANVAHGVPSRTVLLGVVALAIAALPTGLPVVVTAVLSHGAQALAGANAIVRRPRSADTLGWTSAITTDTTGTLTLNEVTAVEIVLPGHRFTVTGAGYAAPGAILRVAGEGDVPLEPLVMALALTSDSGIEDGALVGDPTEGALVVLAEKGGLDVGATRAANPRAAELPLDATYQLMATFHRVRDQTGEEVVRGYVRGAADQLLVRSGWFLDADMRAMRLLGDVRERFALEGARLAGQGLRVLAIAQRDYDARAFDAGADLLPLVDDLTMLAFVGLVDPPRPQARASIRAARAAGLRVRMVSGDPPATAEAIARELEIDGRAITGAELAAMSDEAAAAAIGEIGVVAGAAPEHELRLVEVLRRQGDVVAVAGNGVAAAPALRAADVGIAMGGAGACERAASMVVGDGDIATVVRAIEVGRGLRENLATCVRFHVGVAAGFALTFVGASIFHIAGGLPLLPLQIVYMSLTVQVSQSIGLGRRTSAAHVTDGSYPWLAVVGAVHAAGALAVIAIGQHEYGTPTARTMGLVTFASTNVLYSLTLRDERRSLFSRETLAERALLAATGVSVLAILLAAESGMFRRMLDTASLDFDQWLLCLAAAAPIVLVAEIRARALRARSRSSPPAG